MSILSYIYININDFMRHFFKSMSIYSIGEISMLYVTKKDLFHCHILVAMIIIGGIFQIHAGGVAGVFVVAAFKVHTALGDGDCGHHAEKVLERALL